VHLPLRPPARTRRAARAAARVPPEAPRDPGNGVPVGRRLRGRRFPLHQPLRARRALPQRPPRGGEGPGPARRSRTRTAVAALPGEWIDGRRYRRYFGKEERTKIEAGPLRGTGRYIIGADLERPASMKARTAAWLVGDTLRLGTPFVPDADSLELKRVRAEQP